MKKNNYIYMVMMVFLMLIILIQKPIRTSLFGTEVYFKATVDVADMDIDDKIHVSFLELDNIDESKWDEGIKQVYNELKSNYKEFDEYDEEGNEWKEKRIWNNKETKIYITPSIDNQGIIKISKISTVKPKGIYLIGNIDYFLNEKASINIKYLDFFQNTNNLVDVNYDTGEVLVRVKIHNGYILNHKK